MTVPKPDLSLLPNQRMKLSCRSGHDWWNTRGRPSFFLVAAPARSLCAIR
jgi:hypothetical protein